MTTIERILELAEDHNMTSNKLLVECKLPSNAMSYWKQGIKKPGLDALIKIADYFNVSLDYLVGREITTNQMANNVTSDPLLNKIAQLNELQRAKVEAYVDGLQTTTKDLFNQGRLNAREKQIEEENSKIKKQI